MLVCNWIVEEDKSSLTGNPESKRQPGALAKRYADAHGLQRSVSALLAEPLEKLISLERTLYLLSL